MNLALKITLIIMISSFVVIGVLDVAKGDFRAGIVSLLLAVVNGLVLS